MLIKVGYKLIVRQWPTYTDYFNNTNNFTASFSD